MSKELDKIKSTNCSLTLGGRDRVIRYGFSAWAELEEMYGGLNNLSKIKDEIENRPFKIVPKLLWIGLVDKEGLNEKTFLDDYSMTDIEKIIDVLYNALYGSLPIEDKKKVNPENQVETLN